MDSYVRMDPPIYMDPCGQCLERGPCRPVRTYAVNLLVNSCDILFPESNAIIVFPVTFKSRELECLIRIKQWFPYYFFNYFDILYMSIPNGLLRTSVERILIIGLTLVSVLRSGNKWGFLFWESDFIFRVGVSYYRPYYDSCAIKTELSLKWPICIIKLNARFSLSIRVSKQIMVPLIE